MNNDLKDDPRYKNHETRPDLAGEHPRGDRFQLYAFILFTFGVLADHFFLGWAEHFRSITPFVIRFPLGLIIILKGVFLSLFGIQSVFSEYTEQPRMISSGLFSFIRHPVYLGALLFYVGLLVFILSPIGLLVFIAIFLLYDWLAQDEEARMIKVFGNLYKEYCGKTPRWLPRLFRRNNL
jgi:protein-S-isoprenylcysteine O-methyltransferase Ste14